MNKFLKPLTFLALLILLCSMIARAFSGSETLSEYAERTGKANTRSATEKAAEEEEEEDAATAAKKEEKEEADKATTTEKKAATGEKDAAAEKDETTEKEAAATEKDETAEKEAAAKKKEAAAEKDEVATEKKAVAAATEKKAAAAAEKEKAEKVTAAADVGTTFHPLAAESAESIHYADGFFYQPLTDSVIAKITGISYPVSETLVPALSQTVSNILSDTEMENLAISYQDLCYMNVFYYDFDGEVQAGELICNQGIAQDLAEIFYELYLNEYQIEKIRLVDEYDGDDTRSMEDNNTSCFNYRAVEGSSSLSKHALGCAIDINPFYNPYIVFDKHGSGNDYISPDGSELYVDRTQNFPYKIDENDLCYKLFKAHGFTWGGDWNSCKDYQHFQKIPD